ncbi:hypothetical protein SAMN05192532_103407 [Alteribacillus iranensis]|uniref:Uncharacterized protein n=1 Tax=Alteribacillus iranensis TaxID=930128 RepID=A0A1I2D4P8_9BACI|nr:hypothetical protein SAMN05192532_103407 [Alteribacillus iranensis]
MTTTMIGMLLVLFAVTTLFYYVKEGKNERKSPSS